MPESFKGRLKDTGEIENLTDTDIETIKRHFIEKDLSTHPVLKYIETREAYTRKSKLLKLYCSQVNTHTLETLEKLSNELNKFARICSTLEEEILNSSFAKKLSGSPGYATPQDYLDYQKKCKEAQLEYARPEIITSNMPRIKDATQQIGFDWGSHVFSVMESPLAQEIKEEALSYLKENPDIPAPESLDKFAKQHYLNKTKQSFYQNHKYYPLAQYFELYNAEKPILLTFDHPSSINGRYPVAQLEALYQELLPLLEAQKALEPKVLELLTELLPTVVIWDRETGTFHQEKRKY